MAKRLNPKSKRQGLYLDTAEWETEVSNLLKHVKKSGGEVIANEAKRLVADCIKLTPPTTGGAGVIKEKLTDQFNAGKKAIKDDIKKVVKRYPELNLYKNEKVKRWLGKAYKAGNYDLVMDIINDASGKAGKKVPDKFHEKMRNKWGRIPRTNPKRFYVKNEADINAYANKYYESIGKAKAGWMPAARHLKLPAKNNYNKFISRHRGKGMIRKNLGKTEKHFVYVANLVDYIQKHNGKSKIMAVAIRNRTESLRANIKKILELKAARKWN